LKIVTQQLTPPDCVWRTIAAFFLIGLIMAVTTPNGNAQVAVRDAMVKIYSVQNQPDYDNPWNMKGPKSFSGSGCIIDGNRILTNAHMVSDQTFIQVRRHGQSKKYRAEVLAVSHEADLALMTVEDTAFFKGVEPLKFAELPEVRQEVVVYGFPEGGDSLSTTQGVISRIEHQRYAHSLIELLATQLDAAINSGNSGGPVIVGDRIVGVVMQTRKNSENIGYMVPAPIIDHFLADMRDGRYDGFPEDGAYVQSMENESLKTMYGLKSNQSGTLVTAVIPGSPADGNLLPGDVILSIDGHAVADDGTVEFRPKERTRAEYYIQQHQVGETVAMRVFRKGREETIRFTLFKAWGSGNLVKNTQYDTRPVYYVYGGLVFCPLTLNYLWTWGYNWTADAPFNLINYFSHEKPKQAGEEVVIIIKVLPSEVNQGYEDFTNERIVEVNGIKIRNLRHLISLVEGGADDPFVVFETKRGTVIAMDRKKVAAAQSTILQTYQISADRSDNFQSVSVDPKRLSDDFAATDFHDSSLNSHEQMTDELRK